MDNYNILTAIKYDINPWYFLIYLIVINLIGFCIMGLDKYKAKKGKWRTPEKTLFSITLLGGGIGTTAGMYHFRHKTKKNVFYNWASNNNNCRVFVYIIYDNFCIGWKRIWREVKQ